MSRVEDVHVDISDLMRAVGMVLDEYSDFAMDQCRDAVKEVGQKGAKVTRDSGTYQNRRPRYRKSISNRALNGGHFQIKRVIYAKGHEYSLTHLLENGHKLWNAPLRKGTGEFKHWINGQDYVEDNLPKVLAKKLGG